MDDATAYAESTPTLLLLRRAPTHTSFGLFVHATNMQMRTASRTEDAFLGDDAQKAYNASYFDSSAVCVFSVGVLRSRNRLSCTVREAVYTPTYGTVPILLCENTADSSIVSLCGRFVAFARHGAVTVQLTQNARGVASHSAYGVVTCMRWSSHGVLLFSDSQGLHALRARKDCRFVPPGIDYTVFKRTLEDNQPSYADAFVLSNSEADVFCVKKPAVGSCKVSRMSLHTKDGHLRYAASVKWTNTSNNGAASAIAISSDDRYVVVADPQSATEVLLRYYSTDLNLLCTRNLVCDDYLQLLSVRVFDKSWVSQLAKSSAVLFLFVSKVLQRRSQNRRKRMRGSLTRFDCFMETFTLLQPHAGLHVQLCLSVYGAQVPFTRATMRSAEHVLRDMLS